MTDPLTPEFTPDAPLPLPGLEPVEPGTSAPAQSVHRDEVAPGTSPRRASGIRWAIALIGVAVVLGVTAAIIALASGRPEVSVAVGYMPADTVQYAEYRLDLPGDQRQKLASFLAPFPGFDDPAPFDAKLDETFDRIIAGVSSGEQTYTADIKPWFGGVIAMGSAAPAVPDGSGASMTTFGTANEPLIVVSITDRAKAESWIANLHDTNLTRGTYNGATIFTAAGSDSPTFAIGVNDEVILAGTDAAVQAAIDTNGDGKLADDNEFKAAFRVASDDYVFFTFVDYRSVLAAQMSAAGGSLDSTAVDEKLMALVPAWFGAVGRFENDAFVTDAAFPSVDVGFDGNNKKSTLLGMAPPTTLAYTEVHDVGAAVTALLDRFRDVPEVKQALDELDSQSGIGLQGIFGWWGDAAVVLSQGDDGLLGAGLLIHPTDRAAADAAFQTLRSLIAIGGGQAGVTLRDVQHGDTTITVVDFSQASGMSSDQLPPGYKAEIAYAITDDVVVIGYGQAFVESVLDAGPGPSLADDPQVASLVDRVGAENLGLTYVDVRGVRKLIETYAAADVPSAEWNEYIKEYQPFLLPFDSFVSSTREDGDLNRIQAIQTVSKP